jgi:predicted phosphoribosyltransferase
MFQNRSEAGKQLAFRLKKYQDAPGVILAVPRGGVPVAFEIAKALRMHMDLILVKKLGHPLNKEYAIGAIGLKSRYIVAHTDITNEYINQQTELTRIYLQQMQLRFTGSLQSVPLKNKILIVVDDGIATGNTLLASIHILKSESPEKIIIAVPVASKTSMVRLAGEVDEFVALVKPDKFINVSSFYDDFQQVSDEEVVAAFQRLKEDR